MHTEQYATQLEGLFDNWLHLVTINNFERKNIDIQEQMIKEGSLMVGYQPLPHKNLR
jgi:hypothetical protein